MEVADMTVQEAAAYLAITPAGVRRAAAQGRIKGRKRADIWLLDYNSVVSFKPIRKPSRS